VGSFAVQLAKASGAEVTAVCSARNVEMVRSLGADHVLDYTREDFADGRVRYDRIIDVFGRNSVSRLRRALTSRGRLVIVGGEGDRWIGGIQRQLWATLLSPFVRQTLGTFIVKEHTRYLLRGTADRSRNMPAPRGLSAPNVTYTRTRLGTAAILPRQVYSDSLSPTRRAFARDGAPVVGRAHRGT
jgi:hypothetical protein